ncbi:HTH-type transcriptional regulator LutR [Georgfuchsia toluolica]|uniref:HTH-type transcriptional regulator LutR n=1 Tax=Georgfuchsia toluolica TaxID=424218 RepID=A0A916J3H8_9PROT|nr:FCD domain-containing protein [Georgfuchsia toluolica]CAG4883277.1 HTH-type transcriptional regulator LutR [Georgfuchsia toluolica]
MLAKISITRNASLSKSIVHEIARLVAIGKIKPGDKFPPESVLAEQMGVGRSSIREAFRVFQILGVTEAKPGRGTILVNTAPLFALTDWSEFTSTELINDIVEARFMLEPLIAAMAAKRADAAGIRRIAETIEAGRRAIGNEAASIQTALDFHTAVADASGNQTLLLATRLLRSLYFESRRFSRRRLENYETLLKDHETILAAIRDHNPKAARAASEKHMQHGFQMVLDSTEDVAQDSKRKAPGARKARARNPRKT